ncbi:hypothetical protein HHK36_021630 [Tetracentron sinense]|uniref:RanBP2-type domain-containing protein n=1 Tax=Tetracentron sinense TaxID=13715 RepID=A0A834YRX8_TETSI|nr:hypothetical protein HHK36_021630 [Tetracentron sinense]
MGSREREQTKAHQPHLSSLVVRPTESGGGSDYEPGEVRRDPPPYSRSDRFSDNPGCMLPSYQIVFIFKQSPSVEFMLLSVLPGARTWVLRKTGWFWCRARNLVLGICFELRRVDILLDNASDGYTYITYELVDAAGTINCVYTPQFVAQGMGGGMFMDDEMITLTGYGMHAGSGSPLRHRKVVHRYSPDFDHANGQPRGRGFRGGRGPGRFRYSSPPYGRGRGGGRSSGRGFDGPRFSPEQFRGEGMNRNNPNVPPREGDWICRNSLCGNLNFARREYCNNCDRFRFEPVERPRRNYPRLPNSPPPRSPVERPPRSPMERPPRSPLPRFSGSPMDRSPYRGMSDYRPPPRGWGRDSPREFGGGPPHPSRGGRFPPDHYNRRERLDYHEEEDYMERNKFDRPMPQDWDRGDRGRDNFFNERRGYDGRNMRRPLSPPPLSPPPLLPPSRGRWVHDPRERSLSPMTSGLPPKDYHRDSYTDRGRDDDARERSRSPGRGGPPPKAYRRESYMGRGRGDRRGMTRHRIGDPY